jgi:hypothetical protein
MEATMAMQQYDDKTEPLHRRHERTSFDDARHPQQELDQGTMWAGAILGAAVLLFIVYMLVAGPAT